MEGKPEEEAKPLAIAKSFDSFDATMRLMAQTGEIDEFKEYISQTQKMRAYKGKIEATSPLHAQAQAEAAKPAPAPPKPAKPAPVPAPVEKKAPPRAPPMPQAASAGTALASNTSNAIMITAIIVLVVAAIGLLIALAIR
jgi:hypothetical protein